MHMLTCRCAYTHPHMLIHIYAHLHVYTHTHMLTCMQDHTYMHSHAHTLTPPGAGGSEPAEGEAEREGLGSLLFQHLLSLKQ